ncbi:MAG: hypothetical protein ACFFB0_15615 [Promethearchaeota archaeon]
MKKCNLALITISILLILTMFPGILVVSTYENIFPAEFSLSKIKLHAPSTTYKWLSNGNAICLANNSQIYPQICSDGLGGAIVTWSDERSGDLKYNTFVQRIDSNGNVKWTTNGELICNSDVEPHTIQICSDKSGGAIITWCDERNPIYVDDIFAQRIDSYGNILWTSNGIAICTGDGEQYYSRIVSDGAMGAIITWQDSRAWNNDIYAQKINSNGVIQWIENGTVICNASESQIYPQLVSDEAGGSIITWQDHRDGNNDIYAQRIIANGEVQWDANGTVICTASNTQEFPQLVSDGANGAIITWQDSRNGNIDIYAQRINSNGIVQWDINGITICSESGDQNSPQLISDGEGGAIITWLDERSEKGIYHIYAQRINSNGIIQWSVNGVAICAASGGQLSPQIESDGSGGAIITWQDYRNKNHYDIYTQKVNSNGDIQWAVDGTSVCTEINAQWEPQLVSDGTEGVIITWVDERNGNCDIYAMNIRSAFPTSNHPSSINTSTSSSEAINWILSDDSGGGEYRVLSNNSASNFYVWKDWTSWTINTSLDVPINRTIPGIYNYTIEFFDNHNQFGTPDTVIVTIKPRKERAIPFESYYLVFTIIGIAFVIIMENRRKSI